MGIKKGRKELLIHHQVLYHTRFAPMVLEKWALPLIMKAGLQPASTSTATRNLEESGWLVSSLTGSLGCPPGSRRKQKRSGQYSNSIGLNLEPDRANLTFPDPQQTLPFLTFVNPLVVVNFGCMDLVKYKNEKHPNQTSPNSESCSPHPRAPPPLILPEISCMACIDNTQGKCVGMIAPSRFQTPHKAFYRAKLAGMHETMTPAPTSFASKLQGLLTCKTMLKNEYGSKRLKTPRGPCPPTSILPSKNGPWSLKEMASPPDYNPNYEHYWR
eukprot:1154459-Pelagomonas_calceolata.AAC.1